MTTIQAENLLWERAFPAADGAGPSRVTGAVRPLWQTFDEVAAIHADRIAVSFGEERLTYRELQARANGLAIRLREMGVGPETLTGVYLERTLGAIVALVAIVKAGGAYLPIDPAYPGERVGMILEDARPVVLLTERHLMGRLPEHGAQVICLDSEADFADFGGPALPFNPGSTLDSLAYVIYTSGSTGKPKGVMVTHGNVARLLTQTAAWFRFDATDVWTVFHSLAFDFSVWEVWGCLLYGGRLVMVPFAISRSPEEFYDLLVRERVTVLNQTPSAFYQLIAVDQAKKSSQLALRVVVFGGEALNFRALRPWFAAHGDRTPRLVNMYGITETTVHVTYREVSEADAAGGASSLIGVPIPDLAIYLLDDERKATPPGEVGEIYVGGAGVARGYLNRPELNAERFLADPFSGVPGARMYKSGDLARFLPDGELEYLGRGDGQVKIHGFRIELGEVEAAIVGHPAVREARVVAHTDAAGTKRLVAYFVAEPGAAVSPQELSGYLSEKLAPWMRPSLYLAIPAFPLTPHGKVDYARLPAPVFGSASAEADSKPDPGSDLEREVGEVWRQVLGAEHVGLDDNFFDIGGTSLLLVQVHGRLQQLTGRKISLADLFASTTVRALARSLAANDEAAKPQSLSNEPIKSSAPSQSQSLAEKQRAAFARARATKKAAL